MKIESKIQKRNLVGIPAIILKHLNLIPGDTIYFGVEGDKIVITTHDKDKKSQKFHKVK